MRRRVLVARQDNIGDVLLAGPCVRAVAASDTVVLLAGPRGHTGARLLPGVSEVETWRAPWIDPEPGACDAADIEAATKRLADLDLDAALILTSFHQSPLPLALLLRMAKVPWIGAISEDYPGSLLDLRHRVPDRIPEATRGLWLAEAAGYRLPEGDDGRLAVRRPLPNVDALTGGGDYVVMHPGASVPARRPSTARAAASVRALVAEGHRVLVTGTAAETALTRAVASDVASDLGGLTDLAQLASVLEGARAVIAPNTGAAHLASAVGTPVVSLFAPVVPASGWLPTGVPVVMLGDQRAPCRESRARGCPTPGHPCLDSIAPADIVAATRRVLKADPRTEVSS